MPKLSHSSKGKLQKLKGRSRLAKGGEGLIGRDDFICVGCVFYPVLITITFHGFGHPMGHHCLCMC